MRFLPCATLCLLLACGDDDGAGRDTIAPDTTNDTDVRVDGNDVAPDTFEDDTAEDDSGDDTADAQDDTAAPGDQDGDGLSDAEEAALGTDPTLADSDGDGYWDGWEQAAGSDPLDALATPALTLPEGAPYILDLVDILEPTLLRSFLGSILDRWPPILLFVEPGEGDAVTVAGGIAERASLGPDDAPGTADDEYALELGSLDPATGEFQVRLAGTRVGDQLVAEADQVVIDLSNISELVKGVRLRVEDVTFEATFVDGGERLAPTRLAGILSRAGVEELLETADLPLPIDVETAMEILDPDGDGIITVDIALEGRPAIASGWMLTPEVEPLPRDPGACCPELLDVGDPIDPALVIVDQGLQPSEEAIGAAVVARALGNPDVLDFIATQRVVDGERRIYVYSPRGHIYFVRDRTIVDRQPATVYRTYLLADAGALEGESIDQGDARSPLANQDPTVLSDYASFLAAGEPFAPNADYEALGYAPGDERLRRVAPGAISYPFAYERLAAIFDDPRTGDFVIQKVSYAGSRGDHGHLSALQSRSPLIVSGAGVVRAGEQGGDGWSLDCVGACTEASTELLVREEAARIVDVAPTVAKALGVQPITGVGPHGFLADDVYLAWQDGRPLDAVLTGATPRHAIIIINDGLTSMELLHQAFDPARDLDAYRELMARGVTYRHGAITNFPSNTYPSHNVVGSGAYSGHHGLVDNGFYEREVAAAFEPIVELFGTEKFIGSAQRGLPMETLHQAVLRSFGGIWHKTTNPGGVLTASLNDPSTFGAPLATLERRVPDGYEVPDAVDELTLGGTTYTYPEAGLTDAEGLLDNSTVTNAYGLFIANPKRGIPIPRYAIINFSATDGAGHHAGPHGDEEREKVLRATNLRLRMLIEILKEAGIWEETLVVLTADHGMELMDPSVRGDALAGLSPDIGLFRQHAFVYLKQLAVSFDGLDGADVTVTVTDSDGGAPIGGATVAITRGEGELARGVTDAYGQVVLTFERAAGLTAIVTKSGFSTEAHPVE